MTGTQYSGVVVDGMTRGYVAISGPGEGAEEADVADAHAIAEQLAAAGVTILCGGLSGVMAGAAQGAAAAGGVSIGLLPAADRSQAHPALTYTIPTGMGELRNGLLVRAADVVVVVGGSWGTLSELALAVRTEVPVVTLRSWTVDPSGAPGTVLDAREAVSRVLHLLPQESR